jgi:PAS domain S-box-containing protein
MSILQFLLLEDKSIDAEAIQTTLTAGGIEPELLRVETRAEFVTALEAKAFDLILAAYEVSGFDGIAALETARNLRFETPFIFISASLGEELAIEALKQGATDYVLKQRLERLVPCVERALRSVQERRDHSLQDITDRKHAEEVQAAAEQRYQIVGELIPFGVWEADVQGNATYLSPLFLEMTGQTLEEHRRTWQTLLHSEDAQFIVEAWNHCVQTESLWEQEFQIRGKDGHYRTILARGLPVRNAAGEVTSYMGTNYDISDRKTAELNAIFLSELGEVIRRADDVDKLLAVVCEMTAKHYNLSHCVFNQIDLERDICINSHEYHAERVASVLGTHRLSDYPPEIIAAQRTGQPVTIDDTATHPLTAALHKTHYQPFGYRAWVTQPVLRNQVWVGTLFINDTKPRCWTEADIALLGTIAERSWLAMEKLRSEQALRENETRLQLMLDASQIGEARTQLLYDTTRDLLATEQPLTLMQNLFHKLSPQLELDCYYNYMVEEHNDRTMLHLRNYEGIPEEAARSIEWIEFGQNLCGLVAQERRQLVLDQSQLSSHPNAQLLSSSGATAYAGQPLIVHGKLLGTLCFASSTRTRFTREESDLLQSTCDQIAIALERSNLLTSIQQQAEQLQRANQIKDEFLAVLSHELRSPLNPILGWTRLLLNGKLNEDRRTEALKTIERNAKLQSQLIEDLLDISRIMQGKLSLTAAPTSLAFVISAALETVRLAAEAKNVAIVTDLGTTARISGDPGRLQQVVWNLLTNAVKFTPAGGQVTVELRQVDQFAQIQVIDTGKGITPQFLPHVFEYFRQEDGSTTRKFGGLGLGLAIVRQIVELHGGTVSVDSPGEDQGSTFTVKLPIGTSANQTDDATATDAQALPDRPLQGIRALVVDDESDSREFIAFVLEQAGAEVKTATSAGEAFAILTRSNFDILLSDIGMPDMNGYMLMQQVRALPIEQNGQVCAIALTAYAGDFNQQQALQAGFQKHLAKPIDPTLMVREILKLLDNG